MTNWMETMIFLQPMAELGRVCDGLCLCPSKQSMGLTPSTGPGPHPPLPILSFSTCAFSKASGPLGSPVNVAQTSLLGSGITDSWGPYFMGLESPRPMGEHSREEDGFLPRKKAAQG